MIACLLVVALPAEARPLIDHFKLKTAETEFYRVYRAGSVALVETGIGKLNAAGATAATLVNLRQEQNITPVCINVGLAGAARPLGTLLCAHSVVDQANGKKWFPQLTWQSNQALQLPAIRIATVDVPEQRYTRDLAFDMEASGFYSSASKFTSLEFIQSLKVVSDNPENCISSINKSRAAELIGQHCSSIELVVTKLSELAGLLPDLQASTELLTDLCQHVHCTTTQKSMLQTLLRQYQARFETLPTAEQLAPYTKIKGLIDFLEASLASSARAY